MKKINCKNELQAQRQRIKLRQKMLEGEVYSHWEELKGALNPLNYAKEAFNKVIQHQTVENLNDQSVLKNSFTYGITLLGKRMVDRAEKQLDRLLKK